MLLRLLKERCFLGHMYFAIAKWSRRQHLLCHLSVVVAAVSKIRVNTRHCDSLRSLTVLLGVLLDSHGHIQIMVLAQNLPALDIAAPVNDLV